MKKSILHKLVNLLVNPFYRLHVYKQSHVSTSKPQNSLIASSNIFYPLRAALDCLAFFATKGSLPYFPGLICTYCTCLTKYVPFLAPKINKIMILLCRKQPTKLKYILQKICFLHQCPVSSAG